MKEKQLAALIPAYDSEGINTTVAIYQDMSAENLHVSIRTAITRLFREHMADEKQYKKWAKNIAEKKTGLAIVLRDTRLVGIRVREVRSKGDGSMIYLNRSLISDFEDGYVKIQGLTKIPVLAKKRTIRERIKDCDRISKAYDEKFGDWVPKYPILFLPWDDDYGNGNVFTQINLRYKNSPQDKLKEEKKKKALFQKKTSFWNKREENGFLFQNKYIKGKSIDKKIALYIIPYITIYKRRLFQKSLLAI